MTRTPPTDTHLEHDLLAAILRDIALAQTICEKCSDIDFADPILRCLAAAIWRLEDRGGSWDRRDLSAALKPTPDVWVRMQEMVTEPTHQDIVDAATARRHAVRLAQLGQARRMWQTLSAAVESGAAAVDNPEKWVASVQASFAEAAEKVTSQGGVLLNLRRSMHNAMARSRGKATTDLPTGFPKLDRVTGGLKRGAVTVIGARTRVGKSAFAMTLAQVNATRGVPVIVYSYEMTEEQIEDRVLASQSRVELGKILHGLQSHEDEQRMAHACERHLPITVDCHAGDIRQVGLRLRSWMRSHGRPDALVIVDYAQLVEGTKERGISREQEVASISRAVKRLAQREQVPIVLLSQLNRKADSGGEPRLADLRESGAIEQDADVVILLHRPEVDARSDEERAKLRGLATAIVAKNRQGPTTTIPLLFDGPFTTFREP